MSYDEESFFERNFVTILIIVFLLWIVVGLFFSFYGNYIEVQTFNRLHGTDYTFKEWLFSEHTIKDYYEGKVSNVNLNVKGLEK